MDIYFIKFTFRRFTLFSSSLRQPFLKGRSGMTSVLYPDLDHQLVLHHAFSFPSGFDRRDTGFLSSARHFKAFHQFRSLLMLMQKRLGIRRYLRSLNLRVQKGCPQQR